MPGSSGRLKFRGTAFLARGELCSQAVRWGHLTLAYYLEHGAWPGEAHGIVDPALHKNFVGGCPAPPKGANVGIETAGFVIFQNKFK